ncbi:MAG: trigger factor [Dehalococcoidia bacterium]
MTAERLPRSLVALEIEVEEERLEAQMDKAVRRLSQRVRIPGFRPGKAPRQIVERTLGRPALLQEALEELLPDVYNEAIESQDIQAIGQPEFDLKSTEPLVVSATVPVRPTIDLRDYRSLRAPRPEAETPDGRVEESLTALLRRYATLEPVDRPVEWNDVVRMDVTVSVEGQTEPPHEEEGAEFAVTEGGVVSLPGFLEHLIGLERGGPYEIEFALPDDYVAADMAGKRAHYTLTLHEVKQQILPDLDDDFAKSLDEEGIETAEQLRERVRQNIEAAAKAEADNAYREEVLDLLVASSDIDYPEILVEREIDRMIDRESNHAAHTREDLDRWLEAIGRTEEEVRDSLRAQADLAVRRALVLGELASREELAVTEEEIEGEIMRMASQFDIRTADGLNEEQRDAIRAIFDSPDNRASISNELMTTRTLQRLEDIASAPEEEGEARVRGSRRRRGARADGDAADDDETGEDAADGALPEGAGVAADETEGAAGTLEGASSDAVADGPDAPSSETEANQAEAE